MNIAGLRFPNDAEIAAEEAARFRDASPADRIRAIQSALSAGAVLIARSPRRVFLEAYREHQEELARDAIARFVRRHDGSA